MNTRDINAFIAVVDAGSIVQAAAALHLTQPAVTRRVQSLESLLGVELLDRQSKPLRPTATGKEVYQKGRQILHAEADLMARHEACRYLSCKPSRATIDDVFAAIALRFPSRTTHSHSSPPVPSSRLFAEK